MSTERKSNIEVEVIDGEKLCAEMRKHMTDLPEKATLRLWQGYGIVRTPKGTFIFDTDGCGGEKPVEIEPAELEITRGDIMLAGSPWTIKINKDNLAQVPICGKVNLAAFIRVFGQRLENNFNNWNKFLTGMMA